MRVIRRISAVIIGFVLFLSGVLKLMDPVGATLVMEEYFKFLHLGGLSALSGVAGVGMIIFELEQVFQHIEAFFRPDNTDGKEAQA